MVSCRYSVLTVRCAGGAGLNTRRSPSAMRLASISWRWPGTAETPVTPWPGQPLRIKTPTAGCSARRTRTTTSATATAPMPQAGGTDGVPDLTSMSTPSVFSGSVLVKMMSNSVACWSKSTSLQFKHLFVSSTLTTLFVSKRVPVIF